MYVVIKLDIRSRSIAADYSGRRECCFETLQEAIEELQFRMALHNPTYLKNVPYIILPLQDNLVWQAVESANRGSPYPVWIKL